MIFDDTLLSAHLDDELNGEIRLAVDAALAADPAFADRLRMLGQTKSVIASLGRPAIPVDLSGAVLERIDHEQVAGRRRPYYWIATAASLLFALFLWLQEFDNGNRKAVPIVVQAETQTVPVVPAVLPLVEEPQTPVVPPVLPVVQVPAVDMKAVPIDPLEPARQQLAEMIDRPGARRIMIVVDAIDPGARSRVKDSLRKVSRKNPDFGSLSVAHGIVIDPAYPEAAEIFPTVMDGRERKELLSKLKSNGFTTVIDQPQVISHLGLQLVENDSIQIDTGNRAAGLLDPPLHDKPYLAARKIHENTEADPKVVAGVPQVQNNLFVGPPDLAWEEDAARSVPVIVWLTTRSRH